MLLKDEQTASYSVEIWKRFCKWGGIPTGITQNVKDLFMSKEIENIFDNTDYVLMLNQASGDREILPRKLKISLPQLRYVTYSNEGEGLLFFGNTIVPFIDKFPKDTILYQKMTTKPEEVRLPMGKKLKKDFKERYKASLERERFHSKTDTIPEESKLKLNNDYRGKIVHEKELFQDKVHEKTSKVSADNEKSYGTSKRNKKYRASDKGDVNSAIETGKSDYITEVKDGKSMIL